VGGGGEGEGMVGDKREWEGERVRVRERAMARRRGREVKVRVRVRVRVRVGERGAGGAGGTCSWVSGIGERRLLAMDLLDVRSSLLAEVLTAMKSRRKRNPGPLSAYILALSPLVGMVVYSTPRRTRLGAY